MSETENSVEAKQEPATVKVFTKEDGEIRVEGTGYEVHETGALFVYDVFRTQVIVMAPGTWLYASAPGANYRLAS